MSPEDRERLVRIETKLDLLMAVEPRVRKLEGWRNFLAGAIAIIAAAVGATMRQH